MEKDLDFGAFNDGSTENEGAETPEVSTDTEASEDAGLETLLTEGEDGGLFSEAESEGDASEGETASRNAQLARLRKQRKELRSEAQALKERLSSTEKALESAKALGDAITQRYGDRGNPASAVAWDADFMDNLETLAKSDPEAAALAQKVRQMMDGKTPEPAVVKHQEAQTPAEDPRVTQLLNERKQEKLQGFVEGLGVKPSMVKAVTKEIMGRVGEDLSRTAVKDAIIEASDELGWTAADITNAKPKEEKKDAPDPGKPRAAVTQAKGEADSGKPEAAKNLDEWKKNREAIFRSAEA